MWKVLLLLAFTANLAIVSCDDASNDDTSGLGSTDVDTAANTDDSNTQTDYYYYDDDNGCGGDPNAHPGCGVNCGKTCETYKIKNPSCILVCYDDGCDCNDGYVYDSAVKKCVLPEECTKCNKPNEVYDECPAPCPPRRCDVNDALIRCKAPPKPGDPECNPGCRCADNYYRNATGTCVLKKQCEKPLKCNRPNEVYDACPSPCPPQRCGVDPALILCAPNPGYGNPECKPSCRCIDGYVRNDANECIPKDQCGCGGDPNAMPGCGYNCGKTCETYKVKHPLCPRIQCKPDKCDCKPGFVFDSNLKKCVLPESCTKPCGQNEYWEKCIIGCSTQSCEEVGVPARSCPAEIEGQCNSGCRCKPNFLRNSNGTCVPQAQCPVTGCGGDPNAIPGCGVNCGKTCTTYKVKNPFCSDICKVGGCDCKEGFVFDANVNKCVLPQQCSPRCGLNEQYDGCINGGCGRRNCSQLGQPQVCVDPVEGACIKGCRCVDGYLRASNGTCVPQDQCPVTGCNGDPHAQPGCGVNCGKTCTTYKAKNPICPRICKVGGCDCKDGFVFDANINKCVLPQQCTPVCGFNEQYDSCINGGCGQRNCSQLGQPQLCVDPIEGACIKGCRCVDGYLRASNGTCVPQDQCPVTGCGGDPNAQPGCGTNCGKTCATYMSKNRVCSDICKFGGCDCKDGFVFDPNVNKCVLPQQCSPPSGTCSGQNEFFDTCISGCSNQTCDTIGKVFHCPLQPAVCRTGCRCNSGFYRNAYNVCIPESQCPPPNGTCSGQNEFFDTCISGCSNQTCDTIGKVFNCPIQPAVCRTGCRCNPGFYRNADNICVSESQCGCGGDPNAQPGCGVNCGKTCATYKSKNRFCSDICKVGGCDCKDGFVFDPNVNKCVLPQQCSPTCGFNEQYDSCINGGCSRRNCSQLGQPQLCVDPVEGACIKGCACVDGYLRASNGTCVPQDQCPVIGCGGDPNAQPGCGTNCGKTCATYMSKNRVCSDICKFGGCDCKDGFVFDPNVNKCVLPQQCSPPSGMCSGQNEFFDTCISGCSNQTCDTIGKVFNCPIQTTVCRTGCRCEPGFYRNADNVCVSQSQCGLTRLTTTTAPPTTLSDNNNYNNSSGNNNGDVKTGVASLQAGVTAFTGKFLYDRMKAASGQNIIASPFSVFTPLAQLALYADGDCLKQLISVLNIASKQDIRAAFPALESSYDGQTSVNFSTAAKVYSNKDFPLSDGFKKDSVDVFHAEAQELNFNAPAEAANIINQYVESKTNNRIKDLIKPSDLNALTRIVLVNAIYFKGDWLYAFNKNDTKDADFYLSDGTTTKTKLMYQQGQFNYGEVPELDCTVLEMFYTGKNFSIVIILPNAKDGIMKTAESLQDPANFNKVLGSMKSQKVKVYVPPFEINTTTDLADILYQEGVTKIFDTKDSGLSGMLKKPEN